MNGVPYSATHPDDAALSAYHDGELRGFARAEVEDHLAACPRCRQTLAGFVRLDAALRRMPQLEPPAATRAAVLDWVKHGGRRSQTRAIWWRIGVVVAALAAIVGGYDLVAMHQIAPSAIAPSHRTIVARVPAARMDAPADSRKMAPLHGPAMQGSPSGVTAHERMARQSGASMGRLIVRTGQLDLQVADVQRSFAAVTAIAAKEGGYVADSDNNASTASHGNYAATLTLCVPAANFQPALDALATLPHSALKEHTSSADITDSYHDLQARLQALKTTRDQLMALMRKARTTGDAMAVLNRVTDVNTDIDGVQAQIMSDANQVTLSTITVNLSPTPRHSVPVTRHHVAGWQPGRILSDALGNLVVALQAIATLIIYAVVYLALPALLFALVLLARRLRQDRLPRNI